MKNILLLLALLALHSAPLQAQFKTIAESAPFEEPEQGFLKIVSMSNGNTLLLLVTPKDGIAVRIYDANHQLKATKRLKPAYGQLKESSLLGAFETNQQVALFVNGYDNRSPVLYRLIIDAQSGELAEEQQIGQLGKLNMGKGYAMLLGQVPMPEFYLRKDPASENYAVALFNSFETDRNKRIEIVHYNKFHKEISRAYNQSPDNAYKYLTFLDMCVIADQEVVVISVGKNGLTSGGDANGALLVGKLEAGQSSFDLGQINYPDAADIEKGLVRYNETTNELLMLSLKLVQRKVRAKVYEVYFSKLKPDNTLSTRAVNTESIQNIATGHYGKKNRFLAIPQNLVINEDGSYTLLFEEMYIITQTSSRATSQQTHLQDMGVLRYDKNDQLISAHYLPKDHLLRNYELDMMYYSDRQQKGAHLYNGFQYKSFYYLNGKHQDYLLMNDIAANQQKIDGKKGVTTIQGLNDCEAFGFPLDEANPLPKRQLVLKDKANKKVKDIALFSAADYNRKRNVMALMVRTIEGRDKQAKLVWLQP